MFVCEEEGMGDGEREQEKEFTFTFIRLADIFIQSDLQLLYMSEVAHLWSN